jgi:outer membrane protein TolC
MTPESAFLLRRRLARFAGALPALALLAALPPDAGAQVPANPDSAYRAELARIGGEPLSLEEALRRAVQHATSLREAEAGVLAARGELRRESGAFDPVLFATWRVDDEESQSDSPFAPGTIETRQRFTAAGARLKLPVGTELQASLETTRFRTTFGFDALDPDYATVGVVSLRQPLLKGFGAGTGGDRSAARHGLGAASERLSGATVALEAEVASAYWDLYAAERNLAVQRLITGSAGAFLEQAQYRSRAGLTGPSEVATARVFLTEQQLSAIDREETLDEISDRLVTLLGPPAADPAGRYHAATEPPSDTPVAPEAELVARALSHNHELRAARRDLDARRAESGAARWNSLPTLDVVGSVGGNGLTGTARPVALGTDTLTVVVDGDSYGQSVEQALKRDLPTWSVGVELEVPLGFREGRGEKDRREAEVLRAEQGVASLERSVREEVRARHRELRHGLRRLELARQGVDASMEQVRIGTIEYENGRTTAFEVVRLGADLASAQERYSDALVRTAKAAAELSRLAPPGSTPEEER